MMLAVSDFQTREASMAYLLVVRDSIGMRAVDGGQRRDNLSLSETPK